MPLRVTLKGNISFDERQSNYITCKLFVLIKINSGKPSMIGEDASPQFCRFPGITTAVYTSLSRASRIGAIYSSYRYYSTRTDQLQRASF